MTNVKDLVNLAQKMDFDIHDLIVLYHEDKDKTFAIECVGKKKTDGSLIYWPLHMEGDGFLRLFEGFSKKCEDVKWYSYDLNTMAVEGKMLKSEIVE